MLTPEFRVGHEVMEKRMVKEKGAQVDDMLVCGSFDRFARDLIPRHEDEQRTSKDEHGID